MLQSTIAVICVATLLGGCVTSPAKQPLQPSTATLQQRQIQTRRFDAISESDLLAACAGVLQDLGFNLDESEVDLGLLVASKRMSAGDPATARLMKLLKLLADINIPLDKEQRVRASLVSWPSADAERSWLVRITFQRVVWNTEDEITRRESMHDPQLYQQFFERLSKSVFLEAHSI